MSWKTWAVMGTIAASVIVACGVESVVAKDYDQSCTKDSDCVLVEQLTANGTSCTISCPSSAINKKAQEKYTTELAEERADCTDIGQPSCALTQVAACVEQKCSAVTAGGAADAGTD